MNLEINGTQVRETARGYVLTRGARTLHLVGTSVAQVEKMRQAIASRSFDSLYRTARRAPRGMGSNVRFVTVAA